VNPRPKTTRAPGRRSAAESRLTQARLLEVARRLFARHGFAGTSVRDIGAELGIAGSSVLHHVGSKRRLYGLVLERIAASLAAVLGPTDQAARTLSFVEVARRFAAWSAAHPDDVHVLLREMLENPGRLAAAHRLPLADFLRRGHGVAARAIEGRKGLDPDMLFMTVVGAITYVQVALPSFAAARGRRDVVRLGRRFAATIEGLIAALDRRGGNI